MKNQRLRWKQKRVKLSEINDLGGSKHFLLDNQLKYTYIENMKNNPVKDSKKHTPVVSNPQIIKEILEKIAFTRLKLSEIGEMYGISGDRVFHALHESSETATEYARAMENRCHLEIVTMDEIEEKVINEVKDGKVNPKAASALVQAYRLKAENAKWRAVKLYPKMYGDRVEHNINTVSEEANAAYEKRLSGLTPVDADAREVTDSVDDRPNPLVPLPDNGIYTEKQKKRRARTIREALQREKTREVVTKHVEKTVNVQQRTVKNDVPDLF